MYLSSTHLLLLSFFFFFKQIVLLLVSSQLFGLIHLFLSNRQPVFPLFLAPDHVILALSKVSSRTYAMSLKSFSFLASVTQLLHLH